MRYLQPCTGRVIFAANVGEEGLGICAAYEPYWTPGKDKWIRSLRLRGMASTRRVLQASVALVWKSLLQGRAA